MVGGDRVSCPLPPDWHGSQSFVPPTHPDGMGPGDLWSSPDDGHKIRKVVRSTRTKDQLRNKQHKNAKN